MATTNTRFVTKNGLDANGNSITNLGVAGSSLTISGANAVVITTTGATNITLPTSGTLVTTAGTIATATTATNLTGTAWSVPYTGASANITTSLSLGTAGTVLTSNGPSAAPSWAANSVAGSALTGTSLASGIVSSSLTSVGTLTNLAIGATASAVTGNAALLAIGGTSSGGIEIQQAGGLPLGSTVGTLRIGYINGTITSVDDAFIGWASASAAAAQAVGSNGTLMLVSRNNSADGISMVTGNTSRLFINNSGAFGLSGANYGTSGQVLTSAGSGAAPTWASAAASAAGTLTGTTLASNVVSSSLTSVGTLSSLNVSGLITSSSGIFNQASAGNQVIQTSTNSLANAIGLWAGGSSQLYSTSTLVLTVGATAVSNNIPTGGTQIATFTTTGATISGTLGTTGDLTITKAVNTNANITLAGSGAYSSVITLGAAGGGSGLVQSSGAALALNAPTGQNVYQTINNSVITNASATSFIASVPVTPSVDNTQSLGTSALRWGTVFSPLFSDGATSTGALLGSTGTTVQHALGSGWSAQAFYTAGVERFRVNSTGTSTQSSTVSTPISSITKIDSGTANQAGGSLRLINLHANNTGRTGSVLAGQVLWQFSQPTSGNAQDAASIAVYSDGAQSGQQTPSYMTFSTSDTTNGGGNTERMRIDSIGKVMIGTTTNTLQLNILNGIRTQAQAGVGYRADFYVNSTSAFINAYNDSLVAYQPLQVTASNYNFSAGTAGGTSALSISTAGTVSILGPGATGSAEVGYRNLPRTTTFNSGARGTRVAITTATVIPGTVYSDSVAIQPGDIVSFYNNSGTAVTLTAGAGTGTGGTTPTMYKDGTATAVGSVSLAARGSCTIWYNTATEVIVGGSVV